MRFIATVERFGEKSSFRGAPKPTVLLKNVCILGTDKVVTDHLWFTKGKSWNGAVAGCTVEFDARVGQYEKGYKGYRDDVYNPVSLDYRLERPTKVVIKA
ncbi:hypothetical protein AB832_07390 [Flavobacteriaceae bacterium (ex Bugula neritina AB1)]|nr:hypothetical protein AB832_07390 [Flavobacteriaceae bacterium (ex Bugula neritina AB1)]